MTNNPFIEKITPQLLYGLLNSQITFKKGLNIICGENGTGKTQLIQQLKSGAGRFFHLNHFTDRIVIFNPLRNSEKRNQNQIMDQLRSANVSQKQLNEAMRGISLNDQQLTSYRSFGETFGYTYEDLVKQGGMTYADAVKKVRIEFNSVLRRVFPNYEIQAKWSDSNPNISVKKNSGASIPIESLSRGENEALSLLFTIFINRNDQDIFLIDEPELHLNWNLEKRLFNFFDWFCVKYSKQIIITTHSRIALEERFINKTQFLVWENNKISVKKSPDDLIKQQIGSELIQLVGILDSSEITFFVEDEHHQIVVNFLAKVCSKKTTVIKVGSKGLVNSFCKYIQHTSNKRGYFLVDGDNENLPDEMSSNHHYIHLKKRCIENYFFDFSLLSKLTGNNIAEIKRIVNSTISQCPRNAKSLVFIILAKSNKIDQKILDTFDVSLVFEKLAIKLGMKNSRIFISKYLQLAEKENRIKDIFGEIIIAFKNS